MFRSLIWYEVSISIFVILMDDSLKQPMSLSTWMAMNRHHQLMREQVISKMKGGIDCYSHMIITLPGPPVRSFWFPTDPAIHNSSSHITSLVANTSGTRGCRVFIKTKRRIHYLFQCLQSFQGVSYNSPEASFHRRLWPTSSRVAPPGYEDSHPKGIGPNIRR